MANTIIYSPDAPAPIGPYSQAIQAGNTVYVSGQIALDTASGQLVGNGDVAAETHQVMRNLQAVLAAAGMSLLDVVKCSIFVKDLGNFGLINEIYGSYFTAEYAQPARLWRLAACPKTFRLKFPA
ncbi:Rid family detoxifying hydrolase [Hymenobacter cellulosilyticus]|uniref:Rid family detoxifying hydrolase n=1 Tax=Hymenobacter cellulosilyticus TaxID=2932248 RepID=UPI0035CC66B1